MSNEVLVREEEARSVTTTVRPQELLDCVVESVRRDSQKEPVAFLKETVVPHGGE